MIEGFGDYCYGYLEGYQTLSYCCFSSWSSKIRLAFFDNLGDSSDFGVFFDFLGGIDTSVLDYWAVFGITTFVFTFLFCFSTFFVIFLSLWRVYITLSSFFFWPGNGGGMVLFGLASAFFYSFFFFLSSSKLNCSANCSLSSSSLTFLTCFSYSFLI